jgi:hypothetical protein
MLERYRVAEGSPPSLIPCKILKTKGNKKNNSPQNLPSKGVISKIFIRNDLDPIGCHQPLRRKIARDIQNEVSQSVGIGIDLQQAISSANRI